MGHGGVDDLGGGDAANAQELGESEVDGVHPPGDLEDGDDRAREMDAVREAVEVASGGEGDNRRW